MDALEFIVNVLEVAAGWRFFICFIPALVAAILLHHYAGNSIWPWFVSVPLVLLATGVGVAWHVNAKREHHR